MIEYIVGTAKTYYPLAIIVFGAGEVVGENSPVSVGLMVVIVGCAVWIVKNMQKNTDSIKSLVERVGKIEFILEIKKMADKKEKETTTL